MRKVLVSLKPYYYYLVGEGIKKIEVRKNMPRASDWDKEVLFYMSKDVKSFAKIPKEFQEKYRKHFGEVGMQFVCDNIEEFHEYELSPSKKFYEFEKARISLFLKESCLSYNEVCDYRKDLPYYKPLYAWHISDLKIYGKPKELGEFKRWNRTEENAPCAHTKWLYPDCKDCKACNLTRPPQSWCYVEEV